MSKSTPIQSPISNVIILTDKKHTGRVSSLILAEHLGVQHKNVIALVDEYKAEFESLERVAFETRPFETKGGTQKQRVALLSEDQAYFLLTLSKNTDRTKRLKLNLVQSFGKFRREQQSAADYLPFYHDLHDAIKALAEYAHTHGSTTDAHIFHLNYNKLINKASGIESGQRQGLDVNTRVNITNATGAVISTIKRGVESGADYHEIYQRAKVAVESVTYTGKALSGKPYRAMARIGSSVGASV